MRILEDLATGKPMVAATIAIEGINVPRDCDVFVADSPPELLARVTRIFDDAVLRKVLAVNSRRVAEDTCLRAKITDKLLEAFQVASAPCLKAFSQSLPAG